MSTHAEFGRRHMHIVYLYIVTIVSDKAHVYDWIQVVFFPVSLLNQIAMVNSNMHLLNIWTVITAIFICELIYKM